MKQSRRLVLAQLASLALAPSAFAQASYPAKPVKIVVPFSPGTAADIVARRLGAALSELWGQGVVVENLAGAGGNIGAGAVAKAAPDGYTLLMLGINHAINPSLYKEVPYDLARDFRPIARVALAPLAIVANKQSGLSSIQDLVAAAKARPDSILYGSGGNGSITHLAIELLKSQADIRMTHVPYKSVAPMLTDMLAGQVQIGAPAAASVVSHGKAGTLKILAITTARRSAVFPEIPTVAEAGLGGYDVSAWNGLLAPAGTPDAVVEKIYLDVAKVAQSRPFNEHLAAQAMDASVLPPAAFGSFLQAELDRWSRLVKDSGAKID